LLSRRAASRLFHLAMATLVVAALAVPTFANVEPASAAPVVELSLAEVNPVQFIAAPPLLARPAGEVPAGDCVQVKASYRVLGQDLLNAVVTVSAPANRWRTLIPPGITGRTPSGVPSYTDFPSNDIIGGTHSIQFPLGTIATGPTASFDFLLCSLQWILVPGDIAGINAVLSGDAGSSTTQHIDFTVIGRSQPDVDQAAVSIVDDSLNGPNVGDAGYAISWDTTLYNFCAVSPSTYGCTPFDGTMTTALPVGSRFMSARQEWPIPANFGFPSTGGKPEAFEADASQNLANFPVPGTPINAGNQSVTFDAFAFSNGACLGANGNGPAQGSAPEPAPVDCRGNWSGNSPPRYRVTVWVPVPAVTTNYLVNASANGGPLETATSGPLTLTVNAGPTITFVKDSLRNNSQPFLEGTCPTPYNPSTAVTDSPCVIAKQGIGLFRQTLTTDAPVHDAYIADKLPAELLFVDTSLDPASAAQSAPNDWRVYYSNDNACATSDDAPIDPDWYLGPLPNPNAQAVRCVHWHNTTMNTFNTQVLIRATVAPGTIEGVGDWMYSTNLGEAGGANVSAGPVTDNAVHTLLNRLTGSAAGSFLPTPATPGDETELTFQSLLLPTGSNFGAENWHISVELPADGSITFVPGGMSGNDSLITNLPFNPTVTSPLPTTCDAFDTPSRTMTCRATGITADPTGTGMLFRARLLAHVRLGTVVPGPVRVCTWNEIPKPYVGIALDGAGEPIGLYDTASRKRCVNQRLAIIGNPTVGVEKTVTSSGTVERGDTIDYALDYRHLPGSVMGLTNAYVYDFIGRNPLTGAPLGDVQPVFAGVNVGSEPVVAQYTCSPLPVGNPTQLASSMTWNASACGNGTSDVTGVRFRLDYGANPGDFPLLTDPTDETSAFQSGSVTLSVTVPMTASDDDQVRNMASLDSPQIPRATIPASSVTTNTVNVPPNLTITKTAQSPSFTRGANGSYILTVTSTDAGSGPFSADVVVDDVLPAYLTFVSVTGSGWSCTNPGVGSSGTVSCTTSTDVAPGASLPSITLTTNVGASAPDPAVNTATVTTGGSNANDNSDTETVPVVNAPVGPTAVDDSTTTGFNTAVNIGVPSNDIPGDVALDLTSVTITVDPTYGSVSVNPTTGVVTYTPASGHIGGDQFTYEICDANAFCDTAVVTIGVPYVMPAAVDDHVSTALETPVAVLVLTNDSASAGIDPTAVSVLVNPLNGSVTVSASGSVTYTPAAGFVGVDSLQYRMCDVNGLCDDATVWITVAAGPAVPIDQPTGGGGGATGPAVPIDQPTGGGGGAARPPASLPVTGAATLSMATIGVVIFSAGLALLLIRRRFDQGELGASER